MKHPHNKPALNLICLALPRSKPALNLICLALPLCCLHAHAQSSDTRIESVVIHGQALQQSLAAERDLTPGGTSLLDTDELYERGVLNMADALRYVPGIWTQSTSGSDATFISSRGSNLDATNYDMNGIKLLQDGLPVTTADGNNHNRIIDPLAARFATIARGANALTYGASTLGGAMNFITPTARDSVPNQLFLNAGSFGLQNLRATVGRELSATVDAQLTVDARRREGYRGHNDAERSGIYGNLGWRISDAIDTRFYVTYINNDEELPGALTSTQAAQDPNQTPADALRGNYQVDVLTKRVANKTTFTLSGSSTLEFGLSREVQDLFHPIVDVSVDFDGPGPMGLTQVFSLLIDTEQQTTGGMARYQTQLGNHNVLAGLNWSKTRVSGGNYTHTAGNATGLSTLVDNTAENLELFVMDRWALNDKLTLTYGLQAVDTSRDVRNLTVASNTLRNPVADFDSINPRAGVIYRLSDEISLLGNISKLYEAPTNYELEDDVRGNNATLNAMQGTVVEIGSRGQQELGNNSSWNWDISLYYATLNDEILSRDDPNASGTSLSTNVDDTIHAGIEAVFGGNFQLANGASLQPLLNITINEFSFDDDRLYGNGSLPAAPDYAVRGELLYHTSKGFYIGPTFDYTDDRYVDFMNTKSVDSYATLGLRAGLNRDTWRAFIEARNLTGEDYISNFSVVNQFAASTRIFSTGEPRAVYAGIQMSF